MRSKGFARALLATSVVLMLLAPLVPAQTIEGQNDLAYYPTPAGDNARAQKSLFVTVMSIALFVFVFVEALLLYIIFRFRRNRNVPAGEVHRGHTKAEIVWTIIPAAILLFIGVISAQVMEETDRVPDDVDFTVKVTGFQWGWNFQYPDGTASSTLYVKAGKKVQLDVTSADVIHAVWIPQLGVKIDAVPGRTNTVWFQASEPGTFTLKCAEFCYAHPTDSGTGHHSMISSVVVCNPTAADCLDYGQKSVQDCRGKAECVVEVANNVYRPIETYADVGQKVTWRWVEGVHTVTPWGATAWPGTTGSELQGPGSTFEYTFTADGSYDYRCVPHSVQQTDGTWTGMVGKVLVGTAAPAPAT